MKITSYYYLEYPDCSPVDPLVAATELYVEVAVDDGSIGQFDFTYAFTVCTVGFLKKHLGTHPFYFAKAMIVVERFDDKAIGEALEALLPNIAQFGIPK